MRLGATQRPGAFAIRTDILALPSRFPSALPTRRVWRQNAGRRRARMHMSLPAASQMIDRLAALCLVARRESPDDRRRKLVSVTKKGRALLGRVGRARAREYSAGVSQLPRALRADLMRLPDESGAVSPEL